MLSAATQAEILRLAYAERWALSKIARELRVHRANFGGGLQNGVANLLPDKLRHRNPPSRGFAFKQEPDRLLDRQADRVASPQRDGCIR